MVLSLQKDRQERSSSLDLLSHPFIKKFEDKDIDLGILVGSLEPPCMMSSSSVNEDNWSRLTFQNRMCKCGRRAAVRISDLSKTNISSTILVRIRSVTSFLSVFLQAMWLIVSRRLRLQYLKMT
ncbi:uncharacterized protein LOC130135311 [Syzygium oleosum]|uniref:uncharacterized protein LOC130135311 n=1 Tax=Syzygium oleosum TaxID=219896 RepID=UPI0024BA3D18|nr:uncharacterized protein LOC130135311 [Syzygium oleosum]